jgi:molybdenum cofactor synthesis domain-containing protein
MGSADNGFHCDAAAGIRAAVLTVSDRCSRGEATDTAGPAVSALLAERLKASVQEKMCVPDDRATIAAALRGWTTAADAPDLILTTGGTGLAPRDVTPDATLDVLDRRHSGLMELIRSRTGAIHARAYLSRGEAGVIGRTLVINLPGSERGATECLYAILDVLPHAIHALRGGDHPR